MVSMTAEMKGGLVKLAQLFWMRRVAQGYGGHAAGLAVFCLVAFGCARLPVPMAVIHEDPGLLVRLERVSQTGAYTHPMAVSAHDIAAVQAGFSARERPAGPLRWFGKEASPERVFREDVIQVLAPYLAEALRVAKPDERVMFALYGEGKNPDVERVVTAGWIAVRDPFFHLEVNSLRILQPRTEARGYYPFYPELPPASPVYEVFFEPPTFWQQDPADGTSAVNLRQFLESAGKSSSH